MINQVEELLTAKKVPFIRKGKDCLVLCLNPEHEDQQPSLRIDAEDGKFHCLSCGFKGNIFPYFNKYRNPFSSKVSLIKSKIKELRRASWSGYTIPSDALFVDYSFSGIPKHIMEKFLAFRTLEMGMEDRVVFPIFSAAGVIVGFQGRYINSNAPPKYMAFPKEQPLPWYPSVAKCSTKDSTIVLVEGLKDALYLHGRGIECAVCIFGTKSVNMDNILDHLQQFLLAGVGRVIILMDGDAAGRSAAKNLELCITRKTDLVVQVLDLPDGIDPATMTDDQIKSLHVSIRNTTVVYKQEI